MTPFKYLFLMICLFAMACKKETVQNSIPDKGILYDTAHLGTKINLGEPYRGKEVFWGRNSDEIFVITHDASGVAGIFQVDLVAKTARKVMLTEGFIMGRNFDRSSMLMIGRVNNVYGYYLYHFNTSTFSLLLEVEKTVNHVVDVSGDAIFYWTHKLVSSGNTTPCPVNSINCSDWATSVSSFYFIDANSKKILSLPGKKFHSFSKSGRRTVLRHINVGYNDSIYIFDNGKGIIVDSLKAYAVDWVYYDDEAGVIKDFAYTNPGEITIINTKSKNVLYQFTPSISITEFKWSIDGTKRYYSGYYNGSLALGVYDLVSKKEIVFDKIGGTSMEMFMSDDNKKILYTRGGSVDWFIKDVQ